MVIVIIVLVAVRNRIFKPNLLRASSYHQDTEAHHEHHGVGKKVRDLESFARLKQGTRGRELVPQIKDLDRNFSHIILQ